MHPPELLRLIHMTAGDQDEGGEGSRLSSHREEGSQGGGSPHSTQAALSCCAAMSSLSITLRDNNM